MAQQLSFDELKFELEEISGLELSIRLNNNRSTMLSVNREGKFARVSLHQMFLEAPPEVIRALGQFIRGWRKRSNPYIRAYIDKRIVEMDYSHRLDPNNLVTQGDHHDLQAVYEKVNREYFGGKIKLNITWYGRPPQKKPPSRLTYGLYHDPLKLIKIHRILDDPHVPDFGVEYVVYHEMLHHICPAYTDDTGRSHVHTKEFLEREKEFRKFAAAQQWMNQHSSAVFNKKKIGDLRHGWSQQMGKHQTQKGQSGRKKGKDLLPHSEGNY